MTMTRFDSTQLLSGALRSGWRAFVVSVVVVVGVVMHAPRVG